MPLKNYINVLLTIGDHVLNIEFYIYLAFVLFVNKDKGITRKRCKNKLLIL